MVLYSLYTNSLLAIGIGSKGPSVKDDFKLTSSILPKYADVQLRLLLT